MLQCDSSISISSPVLTNSSSNSSSDSSSKSLDTTTSSSSLTIPEKLDIDKDGFAIPRLVKKKHHQKNDNNPRMKQVQKVNTFGAMTPENRLNFKIPTIRMPKPQHPNINLSIEISKLIKS